MEFIQTGLSGAYLIKPNFVKDERGFFARTYCKKEFAENGIIQPPVQCNISFNKQRGTLRGMHFQHPPFGEDKLVRCTAGEIFDVIIDLRRDSPTFKQWTGYKLTLHNRYALYIPEGFAHGFQTLTDNSEVFYQMYNFYEPNSADGVRWNDPAFAIQWPERVSNMSDKDRNYKDYTGESC